MEASPRTRGSTRPYSRAPWPALGFPAHAGIDRSDPSASGDRNGLPRARGDRPYDLGGASAVRQASPRTRGSTHPRRPRHQRLQGFPAHAGIDPVPTSTPPAMSRLPRARGDRPELDRRWQLGWGASPRTRGSTRTSWTLACLMLGFPAHAGIDLPRPRAPGPHEGLPRARGDRPWRSKTSGRR